VKTYFLYDAVNIVPNGRMANEWQIGKGLEESGRGLIQVML
jgi:hypothetical protein